MNAFNTNQEFTPLTDIARFHEKFGLEQNNTKVIVSTEPEPEDALLFESWIKHNHGKMTIEEWELRHVRLADEADEYAEAVEAEDDEETLDALVDIIYIALGTAYRRGWDFAEAWKRVHTANMEKQRGNSTNSKYGSGFDIIKPQGWSGPDHSDLV